MEITITIPPEALAVIERFRQAPGRILQAIAVALDYQHELSIGAIQEKKLSQRGPETLGVVTGRLRKSIRRSVATISGETVVSSIGSNVVYAGVHEFGIDRDVTVKAHTRTVTQRFGMKLKAAATDQVKSHTRHMKFPARAFIRRTLEERAPAYGREIGKQIVASLNGESVT